MKLIDAINEADNLKPNMYGMQEKIKWWLSMNII